MKEVQDIVNQVHLKMTEWMRSRFHAECSAVAALCEVLSDAAYREKLLQHELRLEGDQFVIDEGKLVMQLPPVIVASLPKRGPEQGTREIVDIIFSSRSVSSRPSVHVISARHSVSL